MEDAFKSVEEVMNELWIKHETLRGRADVLGKAVGTTHIAGYDGSPDAEQEMKEEIAYYEGFCDAAITVLEMKVRASEGW